MHLDTPAQHLLRSWRSYIRLPRNLVLPTTALSLYLNPQVLTTPTPPPHRFSSSSTRWKTRQGSDHFARSAKVAGLKSRAAFKLLELDTKHRLFAPRQTVIDLGYAPGSWSQVAVTRTSPGGRVIGIDVIPAQPPKGASSIQGNFLSEKVREEVRRYVLNPMRGRARKRGLLALREGEEEEGVTEEEMEEVDKGYVEMERSADLGVGQGVRVGEGKEEAKEEGQQRRQLTRKEIDEKEGRVVDVVLSDMSAPWDQTTGMWVKSVSNPYHRMMNTSGMSFRDHAGSMDLCMAALTFCYDTLRTGGHFLCKFYQGAEDKLFETRLRKLFDKVHREKPESSRSESKEAYFVALRRKPDVPRELVFGDAS